MGEIINLNKKRKAKNRRDDEAQAQQNRLKHGRTKLEKERDRSVAEKAALHLEMHKRESTEDGDA